MTVRSPNPQTPISQNQLRAIAGKLIVDITPTTDTNPRTFMLHVHHGDSRYEHVTVPIHELTTLLGPLPAAYISTISAFKLNHQYATAIGLGEMQFVRDQSTMTDHSTSRISIARLVMCNGSPPPRKKNLRDYYYDTAVQEDTPAIYGSSTLGDPTDASSDDWANACFEHSSFFTVNGGCNQAMQ